MRKTAPRHFYSLMQHVRNFVPFIAQYRHYSRANDFLGRSIVRSFLSGRRIMKSTCFRVTGSMVNAFIFLLTHFTSIT